MRAATAELKIKTLKGAVYGRFEGRRIPGQGRKGTTEGRAK